MYPCLFLLILFKIQAERLVWLVQEGDWSVPKTGVTLNHDKFNSYHKRFNDNYDSHCRLRPLRKYTRGAYYMWQLLRRLTVCRTL